MNRRPGQVRVTTEVAMCSFCGRPRTLRREEHQLGTLVRTIVTCETCHRTLSSTMGVAAPEPEPAAPVPAPAPRPEPEPELLQAAKPGRTPAKPAPARKPAPAKKAPAARKPAPAKKAPATKKPAAATKSKPKPPAKRTTTKK